MALVWAVMDELGGEGSLFGVEGTSESGRPPCRCSRAVRLDKCLNFSELSFLFPFCGTPYHEVEVMLPACRTPRWSVKRLAQSLEYVVWMLHWRPGDGFRDFRSLLQLCAKLRVFVLMWGLSWGESPLLSEDCRP